MGIRQSDGPKSRGKYIKITAKDRAIIVEYAANGIAAAILISNGMEATGYGSCGFLASHSQSGHSLADRGVPTILIYMITTDAAAQSEGYSHHCRNT